MAFRLTRICPFLIFFLFNFCWIEAFSAFASPWLLFVPGACRLRLLCWPKLNRKYSSSEEEKPWIFADCFSFFLVHFLITPFVSVTWSQHEHVVQQEARHITKDKDIGPQPKLLEKIHYYKKIWIFGQQLKSNTYT